MTMLLRRQMMRKAVSDWHDLYQQVAYLQSDGNQYCYTDTPWRLEFDCEAEYMPTDTKVDSLLFGAACRRNYARVGNFGWYAARLQYYYDDYKYFDVGTVGTRYLQTINTLYHSVSSLRQGRQTMTVNGTQLLEGANTITYDGRTPALCFALFARANLDTNGNVIFESKYKGRFYYLKLSDNGSTFAEFIPCVRKSDDEPGMYDTVSGTFYTNAGTGEFVVGPDVTPEGYIKSGLVLWLDGIDKGNNSSLWPDKCGNYDFTLSNCTFGTNGVVFDGSTSRGSNNDGFGVDITNATIEYCVNIDSTNGDFTNGCVLCPTQANSGRNVGAMIRYENEGETSPFGTTAVDFRSGSYESRAIPPSGISNKIIFSCSTYGITVGEAVNMFNGRTGTWYGVGTFSPNNSNTMTTIGARYRTTQNPKYNMVFKGTMHSIRIYNRQLTTAEMLHNQRIDNARFNLGLTI